MIKAAGAIEFPPESELDDPTSVTIPPLAPALAMPYMGLCGLLPVSLSERAGMMAPLISAARVPAFSAIPCSMALRV